MTSHLRGCVFFLTLFAMILPLFAEEISHDKFIIHSIPKCGTHFIERVISLMTDKHVQNKGLSLEALNNTEKNNKILRIFQDYSKPSIKLLKNNHYKVVAMIRDPRDALISFLFYMREYEGRGQRRDFFFVSENFDQLSFDDQLTALIKGEYGMTSYLTFYSSRIGWGLDPYCLRVKYEDLVGNEGGGSDQLQAKAIQDIANYLNIELSDAKLQQILDNMYVKTGEDVSVKKGVFTRSSVGNWSRFFKKKHTKLFKKAAGNLLVQLGYEKDNEW